MAGFTRRACYKCGNVGHYAGRLSIVLLEGELADRCCKRCVHLRKGFATIVSKWIRSRRLWICIDNTYRQATWYALAHACDWAVILQALGHESNSCPHPRTTESAYIDILALFPL